MKTLLISVAQNNGFFSELYMRVQEGGPFWMTLIILCFLLMLILIVSAILKLKSSNNIFRKSISLINQIALLALVIGLFSQLLGLIQVFDAFQSLNNVNPELFAGGLKVTLLSPVFGGFTFIVGRLASFILSWLRNPEMDDMTMQSTTR
ncbi:MotA/TolQ/ExbB proton channel family protein [Aequorivita capsosiphonis]|uniref:MotA/TolQ/ExbB proton channel family protein n=1 Tax=Aequorivita capsosiphonis TaxID=487317 RepID=UPI00040C88A0|nr:MotA/TolQ/ExbB proton channel family protein [Aequorivita capsosiphonis]